MAITESLLFAIAVIVAIVYVYLGYNSQSLLLSRNQCEMTMTIKDKHKVEVKSSIVGPKLYKYNTINIKAPKSKNSKSHLNPQPVLFLPGHNGNDDQVRSLVAPAHNSDQYFQYFSVDYHPKEALVYHSHNILENSLFVNDAIETIRQLYASKRSGEKEVKILLVAHSVGGIIAKSSLLLNNHPSECPISDILTLASPALSSPYAADVSLDTLYDEVNKAWISSIYNLTSNCNLSTTLSKCSPCVEKVRQVSFTGGIYDSHVSPVATSLDYIYTTKRLIDHQQVVKMTAMLADPNKFRFSMLFDPFSLMRYVGKIAKGYIFASPAKNATMVVPPTTTDAAVQGDCTLDGGNTGECSQVTNDEPLMSLSYHTKSLRDVEFPIDHLALLWCSQFLSVLTKGMKKLSKLPVDYHIDWQKIFPVATPLDTDTGSATPIGWYQSLWESSQSDELEYMTRRLSLDMSLPSSYSGESLIRYLRQVAVISIVSYQWVIVPIFIITSILLIVTPLLHQLSGYKKYFHLSSTISSPHSPGEVPGKVVTLLQMLLSQLLPSYQLNCSYFIILMNYLFSSKPSVSFLYLYGVSVVIVKLIYDSLFLSAATAAYSHAWVIAIVASYLIAQFLHLFIACLTVITATAVSFLWRSILSVLFLRKLIKQLVKRCRKSLTVAYSVSLALLAAVVTVISVPVVNQSLRKLISPQLTATGLLLSSPGVFTICNLALCCYLMTAISFFSLLLTIADCKKNENKLDLVNHASLYILAIVLAFPSTQYSASLLFHPTFTAIAVNSSLQMFTPGLLSYIVLLVAISYHMLLLAARRCYLVVIDEEEDEEDDPPTPTVPILVEFFGPAAFQRTFNVFPVATVATGTSKAADINRCFHEDGGKNAILIKCDESQYPRKELLPGILCSPTYRVISCNCATYLKETSQWCSWCLCRKCGLKHAQKPSTGFDITRYTAEDWNQMSLYSALWAAYLFVAIAVVYYAQQKFYRYIHLMAAVSCIGIAVDRILNTHTTTSN